MWLILKIKGNLPIHKVKKDKRCILLTENSSFFLQIQNLFSSCGMIIITFHSWLLPPVKYLFLYHSMKKNPVFIEET
jgi:hypothetical protein